MTDTTTFIAPGGTIALNSTFPTVLWITAYVPGSGSTHGTQTMNLQLTPNGHAAITIPISLYVYNFVLERTPHFDTFMMSQPQITVFELDLLDAWKEVYLQHRMSFPGTKTDRSLSQFVFYVLDFFRYYKMISRTQCSDSSRSCLA